MSHNWKLGLLCAAGICLSTAAPLAVKAQAAASETPTAITAHQIVIDGKVLKYTAEAGRIAIRNAATGEVHGYMFYTAYRVAGSAKPRPVSFVWNGGPGADSSTLHFQVAGPKRIEGGALVDNAQTWLTDTDLVFVDPIGTGFSRPTKTDYEDEFYGTLGDVASVSAFVRAWRVQHKAEATPLYLIGESWGAGRAANVGYSLEKKGVTVDGLVLISGGNGLNIDYVARELKTALHLVELNATSIYHGKASPDTARTVEAWARGVYAPALKDPGALSDAQRADITAQLAKYTGLDAGVIDEKTLRITNRQYLTNLLKDQGQTLNVFDMRLTAEPEVKAGNAIMRYFRGELNYPTDLAYVGIEPADIGHGPDTTYPKGVGERWNYATAPMTPEQVQAAISAAMASGEGPPKLGPPLPGASDAIALNPHMKIMVATGRFDSYASCAANTETAKNLPVELKSVVSFKCYQGGHMMYRDEPTRLQLSADIRALVHRAG